MNEAATTWALVVGVDRYDEPAWALPGPGRDALAFVDWLFELGVPPAQIRTHVPAASEFHAQLEARGVPIGPATKGAIDTSIADLAEVPPGAGSRLFVLWSGHGYWLDKANGGAFLAQDCSTKVWQTLGVEHYAKAFRSFNFRRTFLFFDACRTPAFAEHERETIPAQAWAGADVDSLRIQPMASLWVCSASAQGEPGLQLDRSLFLQRLLSVLHPDASWTDPPLAGALRVQDDGRADVLLQSLVDQFVVPQVAADAAANGGVLTPQLVPVAGDAAAPIFSLRDPIAMPRAFRMSAGISQLEAVEQQSVGSWFTDALAFRSLLVTLREHHYRCDAFAELVSVHLTGVDDAAGDDSHAALERRALRLALVELNACTRALLRQYQPVGPRLPQSQSAAAQRAARQLESLVQQGEQLASAFDGGGQLHGDVTERMARQGVEAVVALRCALEAAFAAAALRAEPQMEIEGRHGRDAVRLWAAASDTRRLWQKVPPLGVGGGQGPDLSTSPARSLVHRMGTWGVAIAGEPTASPLGDALAALVGPEDLVRLQPVARQLGSMSDEVATLLGTGVTTRLRRTEAPVGQAAT